MYKTIIMAVLVLASATGRMYAQDAQAEKPCGPNSVPEPNQLDAVLEALQARSAELTSYQANIDYVFKQPLLESQQRRTGILYYARFDGRSYLRIDFLTLQQDDEKPQKSMEQFMFDGVWLWHVDHRLKRVEQRQVAEPNEPLDAFALASRQVPVVGFSNVEDLREQFDVTLVSEPQKDAPTHHLHLHVTPDSIYEDDYTTIGVWVDKKIGLPARIVAVTAGDMEPSLLDTYEITMAEPRVNAQIDRKLFQIDYPRGFSRDVIPLRKANPRK